MHYKRKNLIMKSRDFVRRYLFTARWRHVFPFLRVLYSSNKQESRRINGRRFRLVYCTRAGRWGIVII